MKKTKNLKEKKKIRKKNNGHIVFITLIFVALFVAMSWYIVSYALNNKQELISNSYNTRQKILQAKNMRGTIYSADGKSLVSSKLNDEGTEVRTYHYGPMFAHVVGYAINGRMGIESSANYYLINSNAPISVKAQNDSKGIKYPGDSVYSTLDFTLQETAYNAMGMYHGAVIVTEPSTGKVLALVSKPDFDPAEIAIRWDEFLHDEESSVLLNRVTLGSYPPGSTFKILTALEYIRENPESYDKYNYNCTGSFKNGEDMIRCYHGTVHGGVSFKKSFAKSCNCSFANIGLSLDKNAFNNTLKEMLFDTSLPSKIGGNSGKLEVGENTPDTDMIQIVIGQGVANISPLQLNMITSAIANDGVLMEPYVIDKVINSENTVIKQFKPAVYGNLLSEDEAFIMKDLMEDVVKEGTATKLKNSPYYAGGKTGSAEFGTVKGESHAWFTGYAGKIDDEGNNEQPDICVTIIIEGAGAGGEYAVPIAKRIFDEYYR